MIRPARFQDAPAIEALIRSQHARSKYAGRCGLSDKRLEAIVLGSIAAMNQNGAEATHVAVAERDGRVTGFVIGVFKPVYYVGDKLSAYDLFIVNEGRSASDTMALVDSYIAWARANRKCIEIMLSWADTLPGAERMADLYRRKGGAKTGEMYEIALDMPAFGAAA